MNNEDRKKIEQIAKDNGYRVSSDGTKMINDQGKQIKPSETGNSYNANGTTYNSASDLKNSKKL
ncbi:hypothetical protein F0L74_16675 [Chitinophaga agrisoli]|uniref:Uncharacterized protein n=1 Tax=Chitinophaga agrisoli TaxID=2607653 RepID=A0A5B2VTU3_9BACT|nr:hypothetical protein [Chitinophaga agrisoli]KAA2241529.1 hypothetical protein F0L74_16675 [Chitinophaga agrisoli]